MIIDLKDKNRVIYLTDENNKKIKANIVFSYEDFVYLKIQNSLVIAKINEKTEQLIFIEDGEEYDMALMILKEFFEENLVQYGEYDVRIQDLNQKVKNKKD